MKYLKKFNESIDLESKKKELQEFCDDYLASLTDNDYIVYVDIRLPKIDNELTICIYRNNPIVNNHLNFKYDDIKDYIIPFISMLEDNYLIIDNKLKLVNSIHGMIRLVNISKLESFESIEVYTGLYIYVKVK